jgi:hypothetical protein
MEDDDLEYLKMAVVKATLNCDDRLLLDLVHKIFVSDDL